MHSLVSIIIPTYNRAHLIGETLDSLIAQTYDNWECIVVDDGSSDDTSGLMASYCAKDVRIQYHHRPKDRLPGGNAARNYGFELSKGDYIKWFDSDDLMDRNLIQKQVDVLQHNYDIDFCSCYAEIFEKSKFEINKIDFNPLIKSFNNCIYNYILGDLFFLTPTVLWRKNSFFNQEMFDENLLNAQETDFNFSRLIEGFKFEFIEESLVFVRRGHESIDKLANRDSFKIQSQFSYFNKVFVFLNSNNDYANDLPVNVLKKYVVLRQLLFFYSIRNFNAIKLSLRNSFKLIKNLLQTRMALKDLLRILIGVFTVLILKQGYNFINVQKFDLRKHKI